MGETKDAADLSGGPRFDHSHRRAGIVAAPVGQVWRLIFCRSDDMLRPCDILQKVNDLVFSSQDVASQLGVERIFQTEPQ